MKIILEGEVTDLANTDPEEIKEIMLFIWVGNTHALISRPVRNGKVTIDQKEIEDKSGKI
jgi:hypothetical protein